MQVYANSSQNVRYVEGIDESWGRAIHVIANKVVHLYHLKEYCYIVSFSKNFWLLLIYMFSFSESQGALRDRSRAATLPAHNSPLNKNEVGIHAFIKFIVMCLLPT